MTCTERKKKCSPHQPTGCWIRSEKRLAIYLRDEFRCVYCGANMHGAAPADLTLDHVRPKSRGGSNEASNLVTACKSCNCARQDGAIDRHTRKTIRRQTRRQLGRYLRLAKNLIAEDR